MLRKRDTFLFSIIAIKIFWKIPIVTEKINVNWQFHNAYPPCYFFFLDLSSNLSGPKFLMGIYSSLAPEPFWSFSFHRKSLSTPPLPQSPLRKEEDLTFSMLLLHIAFYTWPQDLEHICPCQDGQRRPIGAFQIESSSSLWPLSHLTWGLFVMLCGLVITLKLCLKARW